MNTRTRHLLALASSTLLLVAAGCGGGAKSPTVANVAGSGGAATQDGAADSGPSNNSSSGGAGSGATLSMKGANSGKFAACMRSHGVPNFPDPDSGGAVTIGPGSGINPDSPKFRTAQKACEKDLPKGAQPSPQEQANAKRQALAFSACMRSHGVPSFPDPTFSGNQIQLQVKAGSGNGLDPKSPKFQAAQKACQGKLPGGGPSTAGQ